MLARVLVVDDSSAMRAFVRAAIEDAGAAAEVLEARSGFEALRLLPRERFDAAIVDVNMPDIHGLEVLRFMRAAETHKDTPVLVISSEASPRDRERGMALGATEWLAKPFTSEALCAALLRITAARRGGASG